MAMATRSPCRRVVIAVLKLLAVAACLVALNQGVEYLKTWLNFEIRPSNEQLVHRTIMLAAILFTLTLALPFVPGIEIGLGLIALLGVKIVPLVYLCTVAGLALAFLLGRLVPGRVLAGLARELGLGRVAALLTRFDGVPQEEKLSFLLESAQGGPARFLLRFRYAALGIALNVPGNFVIGGGGGIAIISGMSRLFSPPLFILTIAIAVSPVPLLVLLIGPSVVTVP